MRGLLPTTGITLGQIAQVNLSGNEKFFIYWWHNPLTEFLFNSSLLLPGQHVTVGGPATGATNAQAVTVNRVVLRHWGFNGTMVANSVSTAAGSFQMQINGFAGLLVPQTVTVDTAKPNEVPDRLRQYERPDQRRKCARSRTAAAESRVRQDGAACALRGRASVVSSKVLPTPYRRSCTQQLRRSSCPGAGSRFQDLEIRKAKAPVFALLLPTLE